MNIKEYIHKLIMRDTPDTGSNHYAKTAADASEKEGDSSPLGIASLEGMSTATARFVIERKVPENFAERWDVKEIANRGRYYIAKVVAPDGKLIDELLVDKQNGVVHFLKGRFTR